MNRLLRGAAAVTIALGLGLAGFIAPAFAAGNAERGDEVTVRSVDATAFPAVRVSVRAGSGSDTPDPSSISLRENGKPVDVHVVPVRQTSAKLGTVLVVDTSVPTAANGRLDAIKAAAREFIASRPASELIEIVSAGAPAHVLLAFTADRPQLLSAVDDLAPNGGLALWDAISMGANNLGDRHDLQPDLVVVAGGPDAASDASASTALGSALAAKALVFAAAVQGGQPFSSGDLHQMADRTGGSFVEASDASAVSGALARLSGAADSQFEIDYTSTLDPKDPPPIDLTVTVGATSVAAIVAPGTIASGANVHPEVAKASSPPSFLAGSTGEAVATATVVLAAVLFAIGLVLVFKRDRSDLTTVLRPYTDAPGEDDDDSYEMVLAETGFVRRAVDTTARIAEQRGILHNIEQKLEQAALPVKAAEALFFWLAAVVLAVVLGLVLGGPFGAVVALFLAGVAPFALLNQLAGRRKKAFTSLLPDTLQMCASTLRSGFSLLQGIEAVSQEVADPMGSELRRVLVEARLGRPLEEALQDAADRMGSTDFDWAIMAIRIQREVGGNLAELLDTVGQTMVQRERLRGEVKALTAEGRMSAIVLGLLPFGMGGIMWSLNPAYMGQLFKDGLGKTLLVAATVLAIGGFLWMKKMIEVEA